jgi:hypothetical protein
MRRWRTGADRVFNRLIVSERRMPSGPVLTECKEIAYWTVSRRLTRRVAAILIGFRFAVASVVATAATVPRPSCKVVEPRQKVQCLPQAHDGPIEHRENRGSRFATKQAHKKTATSQYDYWKCGPTATDSRPRRGSGQPPPGYVLVSAAESCRGALASGGLRGRRLSRGAVCSRALRRVAVSRVATRHWGVTRQRRLASS